MQRRTFLKNSSAAGILAFVTPSGILQFSSPATATDSLTDNFLNPPMSARAHTWWHWMNGNVTADGITRDLEAMQQIGLGGFQNFDAGTGIPKGPVVYLSPDWLNLKEHTIREAERLGLEFTMHNCPGWSSSGGPWITPDRAMQQVVWSEVTLTGGQAITSVLPKPASKLDYYRDIHILAFPTVDAPLLADWPKKTNVVFNGHPPQLAPAIAANAAIDPTTLIDLTPFVDTQDVLRWNAPAGNWTVLRLGYTPLGALNRSAPDTGVGLECDKYSKEAITFHFTRMMEHLLPTLKPLAAKGKVGLLIDSYEIGMQNWTPLFQEEFQQRAGYDLMPYLPTLTGRIVGSADITERFLWDFRRTQADLMADNYYGQFRELCHQHNMIAYTEPYDRGPMEEMQIGARADTNMGEFWQGLSTIFQNNWSMRRTTKLAASIAHINGQKVVGAEAFTGEPESARWQEYPFGMKALGDKLFTQGLNRIIFHRYAHQPHPTAQPGMTMGPWGIHFDRTTTWWPLGKGWLTYIARCQYLLQQGLFVADLAYFTGEDGGIYTSVSPEELAPALPQGYDYDLINAETLLQKATVVNNRLVLPDGMSYRLLILQNQPAMTLPLVRKLRDLVRQGLCLLGNRPKRMPGLRNQAQSQAEFDQLVAELWGSPASATATRHLLGKGQVFAEIQLQTVLNQLDIEADVFVTSRTGDAPITHIHRRMADGTELYFLANQRRTTEELVITFRGAEGQPELWDATTGAITPIGIYESLGTGSRLPVHLPPSGALFIVFRKPMAGFRPLLSVVARNKPILSSMPFAPVPRLTYSDLANHFTISFWAKPELNIMLNTQNFMDQIADPWTDYYAIYPPSGRALYGPGHETAGLTVGRNGVAVWQHGEGPPVLTLAATTAISGWSHIALVYREGIPFVYVNGNLIKQGKRTDKKIHPGMGQAYLHEGASYYNGDMTDPQLIPEAASEVLIRQLASQSRPAQAAIPVVEMSGKQQPALLFWQAGRYTLRDGRGHDSVLQVADLTKPLELTSPWKVQFPPNLGAPAQITLTKLHSLHQHTDPGVAHFSGTATYYHTFLIAAGQLKANRRQFLDLGGVEVIAEVRVNGKDFGILWTRPYRIDITDALHAGANTVVIKVTNLWPNRLIGDEYLPDEARYTPGGGASGFDSLRNGAIEELPDWYKQGQPKPPGGRVAFTTWKHYTKDSPLLESGLVGPVLLRTGQLHLL